MEKRVLKKNLSSVLKPLLAASLLWLVGCTSITSSPTNPPTSSDVTPLDAIALATPSASTTETTSSSHTPLYPALPLSPIRQSVVGTATVTSISAPSDLWTRIRRGFALSDLNTQQVNEREQWHLKHPKYMQHLSEGAHKYLFHVVEELERRNLPAELAFVPCIESSLNPRATSVAKAAGMWQFIPSTGAAFGLKQNAFRDDRRDVMNSTLGALDYLEQLYAQFGDWHLALAAYNAGPKTVENAIAHNQKRSLGTGYADLLTLPEETRMYVPKLQALKNLVLNPQRFGIELPLIGNHPYFQSVDITRDMDVALIAKLAGITESEFRTLNPSRQRPVILAAGMPSILLPWDHAETFHNNLGAYNEGRYASWTVWTVPATMSVATAAKHAGMSETDLRRVNNIPPRVQLAKGSALTVPRSPSTQQDVSSHLADNGQITLAPEGNMRRTIVRARKGDTVAKIARNHKLKPADVAAWNSVGVSSGFKAGAQVILYLPERAKIATRASKTQIVSKKRAPANIIARTGKNTPPSKTPAKRKR